MGSKAFLFLGLLVALVLLISSQVAARDLAETSIDKKNGEVPTKTNGDNNKYDASPGGSDGGYPSGVYRTYPPLKAYGTHPPGKAYGTHPPAKAYGTYPGAGGYAPPGGGHKK